jgi:hypothetical protein
LALPILNATKAGHERLYHYQPYNPEHLADLLDRKRIHCATPGKLNDPWDCRPWFDASTLLNNSEELENFLDFLYTSAYPRPPRALREKYDEQMRSDPAMLRDSLARFSRVVQAEIARRRISA